MQFEVRRYFRSLKNVPFYQGYLRITKGYLSTYLLKSLMVWLVLNIFHDVFFIHHLKEMYSNTNCKYRRNSNRTMYSTKQRTYIIHPVLSSMITPSIKNALRIEKLDKLIVEIQLKAETQCCLPRTRYNWSDEMHHFKIILNYYMIQRKEK
jgi:hypothetical protein